MTIAQEMEKAERGAAEEVVRQTTKWLREQAIICENSYRSGAILCGARLRAEAREYRDIAAGLKLKGGK